MKYLKTYKQLNEELGNPEEIIKMKTPWNHGVIGKKSNMNKKDTMEFMANILFNSKLNKDCKIDGHKVIWTDNISNTLEFDADNINIKLFHRETRFFKTRVIEYFLDFKDNEQWKVIFTPGTERGDQLLYNNYINSIDFLKKSKINVDDVIYLVQKNLLEKDPNNINNIKKYMEVSPRIEKEYSDITTASDMGLF